ncbi:MAG: endo-1,4-beta-xylanase [Planctomycetes bacterium]|nr:endo-1,4-beta-xylanase [Planctomycetota bacterium]
MRYQNSKFIVMTAGLIVALTIVASAATFVCSSDSVPALKDVFAEDFMIGGALNVDQISGKKPDEISLVVKHFNTITPENLLKWELVHPQPGKYDFELSDKLVAFGEKHDMFIVGHALIWHNQVPDWVFEDADGKPLSRHALLARMKDHIHTVVGRYKGRVKGWDVLNEAIADDGSLRPSKWLQIIGDDYIEKAFEYTRQADPNAELYYNDYDMWKKNRCESVVRLIKKLQNKGIRVDGIGIQGHWGLAWDYPPLDDLEANIIAYANLGIKVTVTELDVTVLPHAWENSGADISKNYKLQKKLNPFTDGLSVEVQLEQAKRYAEIFSIFKKHADKISRVTFWGVQDGNSWRNDWPVQGRTEYALLFDRNCKPKPAFDMIIKAAEDKRCPKGRQVP